MSALPAGDKRNLLFDDALLCAQSPKLEGCDWEQVFFTNKGCHPNLNPTRFFLSDWYAWQNPDWSGRHPTPYAHYLEIGRHEGRDPSPYVDMTRFRQAIGSQIPAGLAYELILKGHHAPWIGVYDGPSDLRRMQDRYYRELRVNVHRSNLHARPRRYLVFLQSGRGALTRQWLNQAAPRNWDLLVNYYDAFGFEPDLGEYVFFQKGTKFTAMWALLQRFAHVFEPYDHVLFLDDDVETTVEDLNALFDACCTHELDLAQMTLSAGSSCNWKELFTRPEHKGPREVSAVEIMMPVMSRQALAKLAPTFGKSISGFGLDLTWGHMIRENAGRVAVLDDIVAIHARPVDQSGGAYYAYLRSHGINAKAELWALLQEYGAARDLLSAG